MVGAEETVLPLSAKRQGSQTTGGHARVLLKGQYLALPVIDPLDGERVVCYRSFLPSAMALV
jgi:hypothetical protein